MCDTCDLANQIRCFKCSSNFCLGCYKHHRKIHENKVEDKPKDTSSLVVIDEDDKKRLNWK